MTLDDWNEVPSGNYTFLLQTRHWIYGNIVENARYHRFIGHLEKDGYPYTLKNEVYEPWESEYR